MLTPSRRSVLAAVAVSSLALSAVPAFAGTSQVSAKPKVVVFKAGVKSLSKSVGVGKSVTIDPRATTVPKGDGVTSFTIIFGDGATTKHKGGLTPLKHTYKKAGTYKVTLVVGDKHKKTVRTTVKLVVTAPKTVTPVVVTPVVVTPVATTPPAAPVAPPAPVNPPAPVVTPDPTGPLMGIVKHNGAGVAGLLVVAVLQSDGRTEYRTNTTSDGAYALPAPSGTYTVYVDLDPDKKATAPDPAYSAEALAVTVPAGGSATLNATIDAAVTVTGVVQDTQGNASPATVDLYQTVGNATLKVEVATTSTGAYTISGASDTNNASVSAANGITLILIAPTSLYLQDDGITADLSKSGGQTAAQPTKRLAAASAISGTVVTPAGKTASDINVSAREANGNDDGDSTTDSSGAYVIGHLPAGSYSVVANTPEDYLGDYDPTYAYNTPLSVSTTTPAKTPVAAGTATLRTPGTITGTVTDAAGPVANANIAVTTPDNVGFSALTDASGNYTLPGLPGSTTAYTVTAGNQSGTESGSTTATVTQAMPTTADITLS